jgi:SAM-dependent methyltransferase
MVLSLIGGAKKYIPLGLKVRARAVQAQAAAWGARLSALSSKYKCSVCGRRVKAFEPLPEFYTENIRKYGYPYKEPETCNLEQYLCPVCGASDRDRLYALYLKRYFSSVGGVGGRMRVVDFAPFAPLTRRIRKLIARSGSDVAYRTADLYAENVDDKIDITDIKAYGENEVDFFICSHVLEHVPDDRRALRELYRILKPGGGGILMVPIALDLDETDEDPSVTDEAERWRRFGQDDHVRQYSKGSFLERVREAGFSVHQYGRDFFGARSFAENGISDRSVLYVVEK